MSDKIRKYVLPNLPYLFVFWFFSKLGTAYRIAPGADFGTKLMGMMDTFPVAFENYWPGLGGLDLLVGIAGAAGMYFFIQSKIKKAKKFRRDAEYGTARWGTPEDIKPFVDPKFQDNVILTGTEFLTMNTRPKIPANARNLNACVIGSSGSGKTRFWLTPQLLQAHSSYVCVDPKGGTLDQCGRFLQRQGYKVRVFNSIDFSKSMHYNPLAYIKTESDVLKFVNALIANTKGDGKEGDEFWTKAETLLYCALVAYIVFEGPEEERNMNTLVEMINSMEVREDDETFKNAVDYMFDGLEKRSPQHFAVRQYKKYKLASGKTAKSILISCGARLAPFDIPQLREIMSYDELELDRLGDEKSALFFLISDTDTTYNFLVALAFSQMFNLLCERADNKYGGPPSPPCTGAVGRGGQHRAGAGAGKNRGRYPVTGNQPDPLLPGHEPVQGALQRQLGNHHGKHGQHYLPRRAGGVHLKRHFRELAGKGDHLHADRRAQPGAVGKLQPEPATAWPGADDHQRDHHHAGGQMYLAASWPAALPVPEVRPEKAPELQIYRRV